MSKDCLQLPFRFDANRLRADLGQIRSEEWVAHFNKSYYEGDWSGIALRSIGGSASQLYPDPSGQPARDTPVLPRCPYFQSVLGTFQCTLRSVRLLRLQSGSEIREHEDLNLGFEDGELRLHIPVSTNPEVEFYLAGRRLILQEGECWYLNLNLPHRVRNGGTTDRVHLVIDCVVNDWLRSLFEQAASACTSIAAEGPSSQENLEHFRQLVLEDPGLQEQLRGTADVDTFVNLAVQLGEERGFCFTATDIKSALRASRRTWLERWI